MAVIIFVASVSLPGVASASAESAYQRQLDNINAQMRQLDEQRRQLEQNIAGTRGERAQETQRRNSINEEIAITRS